MRLVRGLLVGFLGVLVLVILAGAAFFAYSWHPSMAAIEPPAADRFDAAQIKRGAELAAIGNCNICHTGPGGKAFAGGLAVPTPFGTIYSTNITPDADTGIGRWSEAAFIRAMRDGVDREGNHLYPAFPYDHFTKITDEDDRALYAFLMTRDPVTAKQPPNTLRFPYNHRFLIAGWKFLYFSPGAYRPDPSKDAAWNRGAYLAEGLGHCGACHTPRNAFGAEDAGARFAGAPVEGWFAYAINAASPAPVPWDADALHAYLRQGWQQVHGASRGPMAPVTGNLGSVPEEDVRAIAIYVASVMGPPTEEQRRRGEAALRRAAAGPAALGAAPAAADSETEPDAALRRKLEIKPQPGTPLSDQELGAAIYAGACSGCHDSGRPLPFGGLSLHLSTAVNAPNPQNIINVVLYGLPAAEGERSPIMPGFDGAMNDEQMTALLQFMRTHFSGKPEWGDIDKYIRTARDLDRTTVRPSDGTSSAPANAGARGPIW